MRTGHVVPQEDDGDVMLQASPVVVVEFVIDPVTQMEALGVATTIQVAVVNAPDDDAHDSSCVSHLLEELATVSCRQDSLGCDQGASTLMLEPRAASRPLDRHHPRVVVGDRKDASFDACRLSARHESALRLRQLLLFPRYIFRENACHEEGCEEQLVMHLARHRLPATRLVAYI